jgi:putative membrane protein
MICSSPVVPNPNSNLKPMIALLITAAIIALSLLVIAQLPLGVKINSVQKVYASAAVFGLVNALIKPTLLWLQPAPLYLFTLTLLGVLSLVVNFLVFVLGAWLVRGFELRWGLWTAILGALSLSIVNSILNQIVLPLAPGLR